MAEQDRSPTGIEAGDVGEGRRHRHCRGLGGGTLGARTGNPGGDDGAGQGWAGRLPGHGRRRIAGPPLQHGDHLLEVHRLGQEVVDPSRRGLLTLVGEDPGREGEHRQVWLREFTADGPGGSQSVHHRHLDVHEDRGEIPRAGPQRIQGLLAIGGQGDAGTLALQGLLDHIPVPVMIVHHQEAQTRETLACQGDHWRAGDPSSLLPLPLLLRGGLYRRGLLAGHRKPEVAADPLATFAAQGATHELDQLPGDGQTQAGTTKTAGDGAVSLGEGGAEAGQLFRGDTDAGIPDLEAQPHLGASLARARAGAGAGAKHGAAVFRTASALADTPDANRLTPEISSIRHFLPGAMNPRNLRILAGILQTEAELDLPPFSEFHSVT